MNIGVNGLTRIGLEGLLGLLIIAVSAHINFGQQGSLDCLRSVVVNVTDSKGKAITGLQKSDFEITDNTDLQDIRFFGDKDSPLSIGIIFEASSYEKVEKINQAKQALAQFIRSSNERDEFFLVDAVARPEVPLDRSLDLDDALSGLRIAGPNDNKTFYDAVDTGLKDIAGKKGSKKILILISDGEDDSSQLSFDKLRRKVKESEAVIYVVNVGRYKYTKLGRLNGRRAMKDLVSLSGGKAYFPGKEIEFSRAFESIGLAARSSYLLGYCPSGILDSKKWHRVRVNVSTPISSPRYSVHIREGYYPVEH